MKGWKKGKEREEESKTKLEICLL